ncbi:hypothetical protein [Hymenobacter cellulosivorans]|uniref:Uncharacterized protein n=1 Tax=Hymenobacter cellulosivorans TaxID=2932249 RepID=A0ABY4FA51_9BACT|nr:hypothetical protein [Hymenobacter cellulosivorans]UOQ53056.1 hypothetical protein MUN80_25380 [Hymenobacter cellulosivorans]
MKPLLPVLLLALLSCSTSPSLTIEQQTIEAYVKASANDPSSYEAVRWGKAAAYTRRDSAATAAAVLSARYSATANSPDIEGRAKLIKEAIRLENITDTTRIGTQLTHAYRGKNKVGALVLDSAHFVVYKPGKVVRL